MNEIPKKESKEAMDEQQLLVDLAALPRSMRPGRDPWPAIRARITDGQVPVEKRAWPARNGWMGIAASLALVVITSLLLLQPDESTTPVGEIAQLPVAEALTDSPLVLSQTSRVPVLSVEREYLAAVKEYLSLDSMAGMPGGAADQEILMSWDVMLQLETELKAALQREPDNVLLAQRLIQLRARQLQLLQLIAESGPTPWRNLI